MHKQKSQRFEFDRWLFIIQYKIKNENVDIERHLKYKIVKYNTKQKTKESQSNCKKTLAIGRVLCYTIKDEMK